jgi:hypothetical protein
MALMLRDWAGDNIYYHLPRGVQGKMAIFSGHDLLHVSIIRRVLLRMVGWLSVTNYFNRSQRWPKVQHY